MRDYGCVVPTFWTRGSGKRLRGDKGAQILALYLFTCPSAVMTGVFGLGIPVMAHETGLTHDEVLTALERLASEDIAYYDDDAELIYVVRAVVHQVGASLSAGASGKEDKRAGSLRKEILRAGPHPFALDFGHRYQSTHLLGPSPFSDAWAPLTKKSNKGLLKNEKGLLLATRADQDQEQEQEQEQEQRGSGSESKTPEPGPDPEPTRRPEPASAVARTRPDSEPTTKSELLSWLAVDFTTALNAATARLWPAVPPFPAESAAVEWLYDDACQHGASWSDFRSWLRPKFVAWAADAGQYTSHKPSVYQSWAARKAMKPKPTAADLNAPRQPKRFDPAIHGSGAS